MHKAIQRVAMYIRDKLKGNKVFFVFSGALLEIFLQLILSQMKFKRTIPVFHFTEEFWQFSTQNSEHLCVTKILFLLCWAVILYHTLLGSPTQQNLSLSKMERRSY